MASTLSPQDPSTSDPTTSLKHTPPTPPTPITLVSSSIVIPAANNKSPSTDLPHTPVPSQSTRGTKRRVEEDRFGEEALDEEGVQSYRGGRSDARQQRAVNEPVKRTRINEQDAKRGQRLFGLLRGTLTSFKNDSLKHTDAEKRRQEIDKKLQEKLARESEELAEKHKRDMEERKERMERARIEAAERQKTETIASKKEHRRLLSHTLKTITCDPPIYYLPVKLLPHQEEFLTKQIKEVEEEWDEEREKQIYDEEMQAIEPEPRRRHGVDANGEGVLERESKANGGETRQGDGADVERDLGDAKTNRKDVKGDRSPKKESMDVESVVEDEDDGAAVAEL